MTVEELEAFGLQTMTDEEITNFLATQGYGVLALPDEPVPYMIPLSFGYDGADHLYFSFVGGDESHKQTLVADTDTARFLVFRADSAYTWESVTLIGEITELPETAWSDHEAALDNAWHLDLFDQAMDAVSISLYEFTIQSQRGLKQSGLPPGFTSQTEEPTS